MADGGRIDWHRFPGSALSARALHAAAARHAELRHAARVCAAVFATFALTSVLHVQGFWAVFTAVIVVQASTGATLGAVRDRLVGTVLGGLVGAAASSIHASELWQRSGLLAVTVAALTFAAAIRPSLKVAPITAAIVMLGVTPHLTPLQGALLRTFEVIIGSLVGIGAALLVFPAPARQAALQRASRTMLVLKDLLEQLQAQLGGHADREAISRSHQQIRGALAGIESVMTEASREQATRLGDEAPRSVLRTLWRVRNDTVLIDRALSEPLPERVAEKLATGTTTMLRASAAYLAVCAAAVTGALSVSDVELTAAHQRFEAEVEAFRAARLTSALDFDTAARVFGLIFAMQTLFANLTDLGDRIDELGVRQPKAAWAPLGWS